MHTLRQAAVLLAIHACAVEMSRNNTPVNVLYIVIDNMRPAAGSYNVSGVQTPHLDAFANRGSTTFYRAYCQLAWCAPSRNSFLTGRRPSRTKAWGFLDSWRDGPMVNTTTLPQWFKENGYTTAAVGKVMHPGLPQNYDYPNSWSFPVDNPAKPECPNQTMFCSAPESYVDADTSATNLTLSLLTRLSTNFTANGTPYFMAVGFQSPRLPWIVPQKVLARYDHVNITSAMHPTSPPSNQDVEWFRPVEIDKYTDTRNISHATPMAHAHQVNARKHYYAAITHVDDQIGRVLAAIHELPLAQQPVVVIHADHGQALGESNLWSMMALTEASMRVPLWIRHPQRAQRPVVWSPVELVDIFPTMVSLAGLPPAPSGSIPFDGVDRSPLLWPPLQSAGNGVKQNASSTAEAAAAYGEITRCHDCTTAYNNTTVNCKYDASVDARYLVPCCKTPRQRFDLMGFTVRTSEWRFSMYCPWNGTAVYVTEWDSCGDYELYDHRSDTSAFNVDQFEVVNVAGLPQYQNVVGIHRKMIRGKFEIGV